MLAHLFHHPKNLTAARVAPRSSRGPVNPNPLGLRGQNLHPRDLLVLRTCVQSIGHHWTVQRMLLGWPGGGGQGREQGPAQPPSGPAHVTLCRLQATLVHQHVGLPTLTSLPPDVFTNSRHHQEQFAALSQDLQNQGASWSLKGDG